MKITLKNSSIYFSSALVKDAGITRESEIFVFEVPAEKTFGFHLADKGMSKTMMTYPVRTTPTGKLYVIPIAPPVGYIKAKMRLSYKVKKTMAVEKRMLKELPIYTFKI